jgi:ribosomal protein S18 acetylase RimI-like enzyme
MDAHVRPARPSDAPAIARVHVATWRAAYRGIVPQTFLDAMDEAKRADRWSGILRGAESATLVAETLRGVVGFVSVGPARGWSGPETGEVWALYVEPERQRRGVGAALWRAGMEELARQGRRGTMLWVLARNASGRAFYEKMGGRVAASKTEDVGGALLDEVAYVFAAPEQS